AEDGHRPGLDNRRRALCLDREEDPVQTQPEADPRGRFTAEQLHQAVVPAPAPERGLLARDPARIDLEGRPRVVVEAADQVWIEAIDHPESVQMRAHPGEMLGARSA